jgi:hypothetical protein
VSVVSVIQHAKRMRSIILPSVACPDQPYLTTLSHTRYDFQGKGSFNVKRAFWFCVYKSPKHSENIWCMCDRASYLSSFWEYFSEMLSEMYIGLHVKGSLFLSDIIKTSIFWTIFIFSKNRLYQISWKPVQWEPRCRVWTKGHAACPSGQSLFAILRIRPQMTNDILELHIDIKILTYVIFVLNIK